MIPTAVLLPVQTCARPRTADAVAEQRAAARRALALCAEHCGAPVDGWAQDASGAPLRNDRWYWSLSHKRAWAGAAIADRPVGIDIEHVIPRRTDLMDEAADATEWAHLGERSWANFYRIWTAKEAVLKGVGCGLAGLGECRILAVDDDLHLTVAYARQQWFVRPFKLDGHLGALACGTRPAGWDIHIDPLDSLGK